MGDAGAANLDNEVGDAMSAPRRPDRSGWRRLKARVSPAAMRASGIAVGLSLAVSGGAYAAVQMAGGARPTTFASESELTAIGAARGGDSALDQDSGAGLAVGGDSSTTVIETVDETQAHGQVQQESADLAAGETKVQTEGVDGLTRTTYRVVRNGDQEISREVVSVVVTPAVDEVVLVGTASSASGSGSGSGSGAGSGSAAPPSPAAAGTPAAEAQAIAKTQIAGYGWGEDEFNCLVSLWNKESGWSTTAGNPSGAYGIPQALPGSKMAAFGDDWQTSASTQIAWGLSYISGRHSTPCGAWSHFQSNGWY